MASKKVKKFYASRAWRRMAMFIRGRDYYTCQRCGNFGNEVHHKVPIDDSNVDDLSVSLNPDNLETLCTKCHNEERSGEVTKEGLVFNKNGDLVRK